MSKKLETLAMVDVAYELLKENKKPISIHELFKQIAEIKNISLDDIEKLTQLYMDITQSAKFVYCGDDKWNLKEGNLHLWDDDGSSFIEVEEDDEEEIIEDDLAIFDEEELEVELDEEEIEELDEEEIIEDDLAIFDEEELEVELDEEEIEELDEEEIEQIKEEKAYIEVELPFKSTDDDDIDFDADDYDEDDYNEIMDDYEDMYDE
ncbi:DNA-directed RNA polymerase subunit delta [Haploplasma axanthum]|uniref:RNAP delta factor n=1 Tax=Haploplasma axanthum TaxID=29552 RepID=A0A449BCA3_HAPAX|nr:DNA-directed RNA polymerase subunit delta [Haploplasma axanthum]VEU80065.1 DNA-directed RNA polymerase subunit delta [Haploplasma axanthum]